MGHVQRDPLRTPDGAGQVGGQRLKGDVAAEFGVLGLAGGAHRAAVSEGKGFGMVLVQPAKPSLARGDLATGTPDSPRWCQTRPFPFHAPAASGFALAGGDFGTPTEPLAYLSRKGKNI
jgi:hypothetical protein